MGGKFAVVRALPPPTALSRLASLLVRSLPPDALQEEMHWLDGAMKDLELKVVEAEGNCNRWTASRGVDPDALKEIYSYLTADMANELVAAACTPPLLCQLFSTTPVDCFQLCAACCDCTGPMPRIMACQPVSAPADFTACPSPRSTWRR